MTWPLDQAQIKPLGGRRRRISTTFETQPFGVGVGGMHYLLNALIDKGLVKLGNFTAAEDKRRHAYILTAKGISEQAAITRRFLAQKIEEYEALKAEIDALSTEINNHTYTHTNPH